MIKTNLSSSEIQDLINKYSSELKKLEFQTAEVKMTLLGLENLIKDVNSREKASFTKVKVKKSSVAKPLKKRGRKSVVEKAKVKTKTKEKIVKGTTPKKTKAQKSITAKPKKEVSVKSKKAVVGKKAAVKSKKSLPKVNSKKIEKIGYKLSDWDSYVIQSIENRGKVLITSEIIDQVKSKLIAAGKNSSDSEIKNKVTRSLQKLVNRRGDLAKVNFKGKGFAYALPNWMVSKGKIAPEYNR